ncbi:DNA glycosylase superfamily protein [Forsythia ovata]|uniref:DNA glycosylase superfamily protein n=1 Tax=Forsythia ovata TaxID=205694 RepID=A0ABD1RM22_9LAMI
MSVATENPGSETRSILAPTGNRVRVVEEQRRKREILSKSVEKPKRVISQTPPKPGGGGGASVAVVRNNFSADSSSDSSSCNGSTVKTVKSMGSKRRIVKNSNGVVKPAKIVPDGAEALAISPMVPVPVKRCDWITPNSEPLYTSFHDEEWAVPVHDDMKLFELLVLSQALAELTWPAILSKRETFRKLFDDFDLSSVAKFDEEKLMSMKMNGNTLLSEPKLRAIVENAKQLLKIQQEFGSFSNYCWRFVNHKPLKSGFRYSRQVPARTPKSELISKDLMRRGFCCVGPTIVYSFMQVAGIVNDHLTTCFRFNECSMNVKTNSTRQLEKTEALREAMETTCTPNESQLREA